MSDASLTVSAPPAGPPAGSSGAARPDHRRIPIAALATELRVAVNRTSRRLRAEKADDAVTDGQFSVLAQLDREGEQTPRSLAAHERVQPPSMNRTINALVEAGYVDRRPHPADGRQILVVLTEAGRDVVQETRRRRDDWMSRRLAELTPDQRRLLSDAAAILREVADS